MLLDMAADKFSNHCCNDLPDEITDALSDEEKLTLIKEYAAWSADPDEFDGEPTAKRFDHLADWILMRFFSEKLNKMAQ
jgi:hypothetical protein